MEFNHKEDEVIREIELTKSQIPGLLSHGSYQATSTGPLVKGCNICTRMKSMTFVLGYRCNVRCDFCFVDSYISNKYDEDEKYNRRTCFKDFCRKKDEIEGIGLTGGETLLYLPEIKEYTAKIKEEKPDIYFWLYTNGIETNQKNLSAIREYGIREIRFNLAASNYSDKVIEKLKIARDLFDYVVVEVPTYPKQKEKLIESLGKLEYYGIDQLNLQELLITENNVELLDGEGYQTGIMFLKKYFLYGSRRLTYEIIKHCIDKGYSFTVNDCSARKFGKKK